MLAMQDLAKRCDSVDKILTTLAVMMNMNLYVRNPFVNHLCQRFNQRWMVFFLRVEKGILGWVSGSVGPAAPCDFRPSRPPQPDTR
jgi:hypothetical protein